MPTNGLNTGHDVTLQISIGTLGIVTFSNLQLFNLKQETTQLKSKPISGPPIFAEVPEGWTFDLDFQRSNSNIDDAFAAMEQAYYNKQDIGQGTITQTIAENGGGISQYRLVGVALKLSDAGSYKGDGLVDQKVSGAASQRVKVI